MSGPFVPPVGMASTLAASAAKRPWEGQSFITAAIPPQVRAGALAKRIWLVSDPRNPGTEVGRPGRERAETAAPSDEGKEEGAQGEAAALRREDELGDGDAEAEADAGERRRPASVFREPALEIQDGLVGDTRGLAEGVGAEAEGSATGRQLEPEAAVEGDDVVVRRGRDDPGVHAAQVTDSLRSGGNFQGFLVSIGTQRRDQASTRMQSSVMKAAC